MAVPVSGGLVLHLETDFGITTSNGIITSWQDASGSGNTLTASGDPTLGVAKTPSGAAAIDLDGTGDKLERLAGLTNLPAGGADRTVFFVVKYIDHEGVSAGFAYGDSARNETFGLVSGWDDGDLEVQLYGSADKDSNVPAAPQGWIVQSVVVSASQYAHYLNGGLIGSGTQTFKTDVQKLLIGAEIGGKGEASLQVAGVLVYDRALTTAERQQVETYLQEKYLADDGLNDTPVAVADTAGVVPGQTVAINVLANDIDDAPLNGSMITIVDAPDNGTLSAPNPVTGAVSYTHNGGATTADSFTYTLTDANGATSNPATVSINIGAQPLSLEGFTDEVVITRDTMNATSPFFLPISMAFLPDNRMLLLSKDGEILIVDPESGSSSTYMVLNNIDAGQERGLLDITLDPNFATNGYFYLYYTPNSPENARIARFQHQENAGGLTSTGNLSSEFTVWQDTDGYLACCHYGGGLDFGPDGKIWLTTSDKFQATTPGEGSAGGIDLMLDLNSSSGKIIRVNPDGSVPDGTDGWAANPWYQPGDGGNDFVWAYGLRNPFRARWDADYGQMYIGEVGGNQQLIAHDDIHVASLDQAGVFYGWPFYEGTTNTYTNAGQSPNNPNNYPLPDGDIGDPANGDFYSSAIFSIAHNGKSTSITGGEVYRGDMFPNEWNGVYFYGDYTNDFIRYLVLDATGTEVLGNYAFKPSAALPGTTNEIVSIAVGNDGALYYVMIASGEVHRVVYEGNAAPAIVAAGLTPLEGGLPLNVTFNATVSDAEGDALTYVLNFGDGTVVNGSVTGGTISVDHTYTTDGRYNVSLSLSDPTHTVLSQPLHVDAGDVNFAPVITGAASDVQITGTGSDVTFSAAVSDPDNDQLTYTWHFGDGTSVAGTLTAAGTVTATHAYATEGSFQAYLQVSDGAETVFSPNLPVQVGQATEVPVTNGLVLLLQSDIKIGLAQGNTVAAWLDGSGNGNNLFAQGDPELLENQTPTGQSAIVFDGTGDLLQRITTQDTIFNMPTGSADRTMFLVVNYVNPEGISAGLVYGDGATNEAFGLVAAADDHLEIQGWGRRSDFDSGVGATTSGWMVQSVVLDDNFFRHFRNGALIDDGTKAFATDVQKLILGGEIAGLGESQMKIAAALIYDRALTETERQQVEAFLQDKYITANPVNQPAVAVDDSYGATAGSSLVVAAPQGVLANDSDPEGDAFSASLVSGPANGTLTLNPNGSFTYTPATGFVGADSFVYRVTGGDTANVVITVQDDAGGLVTAGLIAAYESTENVSTGVGNQVTGWLDGSGRGNDLLALGDPELIANATPTGRAAIAFDGTGDLLQRVNTSDTLNGFVGGAGDRTMFFVVKYVNPEGISAGLAYGDGATNEAFGLVAAKDNHLEVQAWGKRADADSGVGATTSGWLVQSVVLDDNFFRHYKNGALIDDGAKTFATDVQKLVIGGEIAGLGESQMQVAAAFVYDRALTEAERADMESYLQHTYINDAFVFV